MQVCPGDALRHDGSATPRLDSQIITERKKTTLLNRRYARVTISHGEKLRLHYGLPRRLAVAPIDESLVRSEGSRDCVTSAAVRARLAGSSPRVEHGTGRRAPPQSQEGRRRTANHGKLPANLAAPGQRLRAHFPVHRTVSVCQIMNHLMSPGDGALRL